MRLRKKVVLNSKDRIIITFILIFFITFLILRLINIETKKVLVPYLNNDMKKYSLQIINSSIIENNDKKYFDDLIITEKNNSGEIIGVDFDTLKLNKLLANINNNVIINLNSLEKGEFETTYGVNNGIYSIPFYIFSNNILLKNLGFEMPFKIKVIGNAISNIKTDLKDYGINNTIVTVYINMNINMQVILPFKTDEIKVNTEIPVMMKIINGKVPDVYGGMYSVNSSSV